MEGIVIPKHSISLVKYIRGKDIAMEKVATPSSLENIFSWGE
jgi:hypothetical protein